VRIAVVVVSLAAVTAAALLGARTSATGSASGPLRWEPGAFSFAHETIAGDYVASGAVRNTSGKPVRLVATRNVKVVDADGTPLRSAAVFSNTVGHGLFDPTRLPPARLPEQELRRIGEVGLVAPGKPLPLTVSWHEEPGGPHAARIEYRGGSLPVPDERRAPAG
jgi:hypothetical protein